MFRGITKDSFHKLSKGNNFLTNSIQEMQQNPVRRKGLLRKKKKNTECGKLK